MIFIVAIIFIGLVAFDLAAMRWGADSRDQLPPEHHD
jgi:hypothetical protein